jgi:hypothetical protein
VVTLVVRVPAKKPILMEVHSHDSVLKCIDCSLEDLQSLAGDISELAGKKKVLVEFGTKRLTDAALQTICALLHVHDVTCCCFQVWFYIYFDC